MHLNAVSTQASCCFSRAHTLHRFKNTDKVPAFVDRAFHPAAPLQGELKFRSSPAQVNGTLRPKYFKRPVLAAAEVLVKQAPPPMATGVLGSEPSAGMGMGMSGADVGHPEPRAKTIGTQSDYREGEAQTAPWEPDYVIPEEPTAKQAWLSKRNFAGEGVPELIHLKELQFPDGLPAGED